MDRMAGWATLRHNGAGEKGCVEKKGNSFHMSLTRHESGSHSAGPGLLCLLGRRARRSLPIVVLVSIALLLMPWTGLLAVDSEFHAEDPWARIGQRLALEACASGEQSLFWARHYAAHPDYLDTVLARAEPWVAGIADELEQRDLPGELALVPMIESGYDPYAFSRRGAAGAWQLLEPTARSLGLVIDEHFDARRDMPEATSAALDYFEAMHRRLNDRWDLALAAYNAGPGRVARLSASGALSVQPWKSAELPGETRIYLARLLGLACLLAQPDRFEYDWPRVPVDSAALSITLDYPVDLAELAVRAGLDIQGLVELNAGHRRLDARVDHLLTLNVLAADRERVIAALERKPGALESQSGAAYRQARAELVALKSARIPENRNWHEVAPGETLWTLSHRYSVGADTIRRVNRLEAGAEVRAGEMIRIPAGVPTLLPDQYRVQPGDTLWSIAREQRVPVALLKRLNQISEDTTLQPGDVLELGEPRCCDQIPSLFEPIATGY
ncbi:MAG: LysM peptidoglycan-binding domain-containing protein [Wenzhouxiangella sp.]|nr:MAG: LysM peptidoglycan-binding domain-containing protein [Wenzhouxiangella sp.]